MENNKQIVVEGWTDRFQQIMEYTMTAKNGGRRVVEAGDDQDPNAAPGGDPMGGGAPMGGDPGMGGAPGGDPMGGGAPMGGDPGMGGDPNAMGGDPNAMGGDPNAAPGGDQAATPEGFNPQGGMDPGMGGDPMMGGDPGMGMGDQMQPDDEVIDVDDLTDAQEETEEKVEKLGGKFDEVLKAIGSFEELIRANDQKIEDLKVEFEKRNPTQIEKLGMQASKSYPFNVTPEEYWKEKEATSNYRTEDDDNGKEQGQYVITKNDVDGDTNWKAIADSLGGEDFMYNQTLNKILRTGY